MSTILLILQKNKNRIIRAISINMLNLIPFGFFHLDHPCKKFHQWRTPTFLKNIFYELFIIIKQYLKKLTILDSPF